MKYVQSILIAIIISFQLMALSANATEIRSKASGKWSSPSTWEGGVVPSEMDDVIIKNWHTVHIDMSDNNVVTLCHNLTVNPNGVIQLGHNSEGVDKVFELTGSVYCNGTISAGRKVGGNNSEGLVYKYNSTIQMSLADETTEVSGKGYFHPQNLIFSVGYQERTVNINHYNIVTDEDFEIHSKGRVTMSLDHYSYLYVKGTLGITGDSDNAPAEAKSFADFTVDGIVIANDLNLFTKNTRQNSSITIREEGSIYAKEINGGNASIKNATGTFTLNIEESGLFRCDKNVRNPLDIVKNDSKLTVNNAGEIREHYAVTMETANEVVSKVNQAIPENNKDAYKLRDVFGATHIAGWYNFTDKNYLQEGVDKYEEWGSTAIKTSLSANKNALQGHYPFNHTFPNLSTMLDVAKYSLMDSLFTAPHIKTHAMWTYTGLDKGFYKDGPDRNHNNFLEEEEHFYQVTKYILETYGHLGKRFVFQNWEGDWMLRGQGKKWEGDDPIPANVEWQAQGMARMFRAHHRGIQRAREEYIAENPQTKSEVLLAIEYNKCFFKNSNGVYKTMMDEGIPCLLSDVIPFCRIDLSSWSSYDGRWSNTATPFPYSFWQGVRIAQYYTTNSTAIQEGIPFQVGEFAYNENPKYSTLTQQDILDNYKQLCGLTTAMGIQQFYLWNFYCSGQQGISLTKGVQYETEFLYEYMDGKWVVEPDGSWGTAGNYLRNIFKSVQLNGQTYSSIQQAIDNASDGDIINFSGIHTEKLTINKSIILKGKNPKLDIIQAADDWASSNGRVVTVEGNAEQVTLENLTLRYGNAGNHAGGGIYISPSTENVVLKNVSLTSNKSNKNGGGIAVEGSNITLKYVTINQNISGETGGGIYLASDNLSQQNISAQILSSVIDNNTADGNGGGLAIDGNDSQGNEYSLQVDIENTTIAFNQSKDDGGAMYVKGVSLSGGSQSNVNVNINHATVAYNQATGLRNGFYFDALEQIAGPVIGLYNSIVALNAESSDKDVDFLNSDTQYVINCILGEETNMTSNSTNVVSTQTGKSNAFISLADTLADKGGKVKVLTIAENSGAFNYADTQTGAVMDALNRVRSQPDAGAYEYPSEDTYLGEDTDSENPPVTSIISNTRLSDFKVMKEGILLNHFSVACQVKLMDITGKVLLSDNISPQQRFVAYPFKEHKVYIIHINGIVQKVIFN